MRITKHIELSLLRDMFLNGAFFAKTIHLCRVYLRIRNPKHRPWRDAKMKPQIYGMRLGRRSERDQKSCVSNISRSRWNKVFATNTKVAKLVASAKQGCDWLVRRCLRHYLNFRLSLFPRRDRTLVHRSPSKTMVLTLYLNFLHCYTSAKVVKIFHMSKASLFNIHTSVQIWAEIVRE